MSQVLVCDRPVTGLSRGCHTNRNCATPYLGVAVYHKPNHTHFPPTTPIFHQPPPFSTNHPCFQPIRTYFNPSASVSSPPASMSMPYWCRHQYHPQMHGCSQVCHPPFSPPIPLSHHHAASHYIHLLLK